MKRLTTAIVGLAAAGLVLSSVPAQAGSDTIKVGVGISGVKVGHKKKTVVRKLGQPLHVQKGRNDDGPYQVLTYPHALSVTLVRKYVTNVVTVGAKQRTSKGIGVGSTKAELTSAYSVSCQRVATERHLKSCTIGEMKPGEIVTDFRLSRNVIHWVGIGTVLS